MKTTEGVDFFLGGITALAAKTKLEAYLAERYAFEAKQGRESLNLEALETALCKIKRNADELLHIFNRLVVAKWEEEHKEGEEDEEELWLCHRD